MIYNKSAQNKIERGFYYYSVDFLRLLLIMCLIFSRYGLPVLSGYITPFLNFAPGLLYLLYGYFVLRDGRDLKKDIKRVAVVFAIMFAVCFVLATIYMYFVYGTPFAYLTKRGIFNFLVLNYWGPSMGDYIWYIQSILYSLIICYVFRKLKKFDVPVCIILFVISFLIGEGAGLIHFSLLGYTYIPGNFLTRTLPYMLLGRIMHRHKKKLKKLKKKVYFLIIAAGLALSIAEMIGFSALNVLVYYGHLAGFILISAGLAGLFVTHRHRGKKLTMKHFELYKKVFYIFNPLGEILTVLLTILALLREEYNALNAVGIMVCILSVLLALGWEFIENKVRKKKMKSAPVVKQEKNDAK